MGGSIDQIIFRRVSLDCRQLQTRESGYKKSQKFADVLNGWSLTLMTSIEKANSLEHTSWNYSFNDVFGKYLLNSHILEPMALNMLG